MTTTEVTRDQIVGRRAAAEDDLAAAESALGAATLNGTGEPAARKRLAEAKAAVEALDAADAEIARREVAEQQKTAEREEALGRCRALLWRAAFLRRQVGVAQMRADLEAAEVALLAMRLPADRTRKADTLRAYQVDDDLATLEEFLGEDLEDRIPSNRGGEARARARRALTGVLIPTGEREAAGKHLPVRRAFKNEQAQLSDLDDDKALQAADELEKLAAGHARRAGVNLRDVKRAAAWWPSEEAAE